MTDVPFAEIEAHERSTNQSRCSPYSPPKSNVALFDQAIRGISAGGIYHHLTPTQRGGIVANTLRQHACCGF